jgi:hypothetical protein
MNLSREIFPVVSFNTLPSLSVLSVEILQGDANDLLLALTPHACGWSAA